MELSPMAKKIIISPIEENTEVNGIITSFKKKSNHSLGVVIRVGDDCGCVKAGQTVVFNPRGVTKYDDYLISNYDNIIGILEE